MKELLSNAPETYRVALREFLEDPNEGSLQQAYEFGRAALNAGLGVVDVIRLHHQALADGANPCGEKKAGFIAPAIESFLLEALAPFEAAYRGFGKVRERLQQINGVLAERNEELARSNAHLEEEIRVRQRAENDLRESKNHYFQLFQQAHTMEGDLRELSTKVLSAQEEERKRISRELHDEIGQALTAVNIAITMLKKQARLDQTFELIVAGAEQLLAQSMETVHTFARELRPAMLDHLGLHAALRSHVAIFTRRTGIETELTAHPKMDLLDGLRAEVLFRVAQEGLNNVFKHARATIVKIEFTVSGEMLVMDISDNGRAFCVEKKLSAGPTGRLGLLGMQERVRLANGSFAIESSPGTGTRIRVQIPFNGRSTHVAEAKTPGAENRGASFCPIQIDYNENNIRAAC
jgi:signal transduction histidine kinase